MPRARWHALGRPPAGRPPDGAPDRHRPARALAGLALAVLILAGPVLLAGCAGLRGGRDARPKPGPDPRGAGRDPVVYGFYTEPEPEAGLPGSFATMQRHARDLDVIVPFWFRLVESGDGTIEPYGAPEAGRRREIITEAHRRGLKVELIIHNLLYGSARRSAETARRFLRDEAAQERAVRGIRDLLRQEGYDGVHIDLEAVPPEERPRLTAFVQRVRRSLPRGKMLSVAVFPRDREDRDDRNTGAYDYPALGRAVDYFILMTYSEHTAETGPGPLASRDYVERMLRYATRHVPRDKILVGLGGFGFDWGGGGLPRYLSHAQAMDLARERGVPVRWDDAAQVPYFTYSENGQDHAVYFEDARSWAAKLEVARRYGVRGVAIWRLGMEDERGWREIQRKLR
ncbi:MAG TPA: glycosyl hydrolase family 18 protein [Thermaerobacter sp.]